MQVREVILRGDRASQPVAGDENDGFLYFVTDEEVLERSDGSTWESYSSSTDADISDLAGLDSSTAGAIASDGAGWIKKTYAQFKTALSLVKADVGLGSVDNTSDAGKPVSTAQQTALDGKQNLDSDLTAIAGLSPSNDDVIQRKAGSWINRTIAQLKSDFSLVKADVGLGSVDNTSDAGKPVSTAQQTALDLKLNLAGGTLSGEVNAIDDVYDDSWNANAGVPQKDDIYDANLETDITLKAYQAMGSPIVAMTIGGMQFPSKSTSGALTDAQIRLSAVYLSRRTTLTGVKWYQVTAGSYTADQNNKIGLYTCVAGVLTLVASCANDGNIWKATSNSWASKAFSSTYDALPGLYFVASLYNNSAQTTAPVLAAVGGTIDSNAQLTMDFTNSSKISASLAAQTDLITPSTMGAFSAQISYNFFALY